MNPFRATWRWLRSLANRQAVKLEIDEELRFHVEQRTADNMSWRTQQRNGPRSLGFAWR